MDSSGEVCLGPKEGIGMVEKKTHDEVNAWVSCVLMS